MILVSWKPRAFLFKDFLTEEECDYMISKVCSLNLPALTLPPLPACADLLGTSAMQAKPSMTKSTVVDNETGKSMDSTVRTSTGTFFGRGQDEVIHGIEKRIALVRSGLSTPAACHSSCFSFTPLALLQVSHLPAENGEGLQILHYVNGQKYEPHHDFFHDRYAS